MDLDVRVKLYHWIICRRWGLVLVQGAGGSSPRRIRVLGTRKDRGVMGPVIGHDTEQGPGIDAWALSIKHHGLGSFREGGGHLCLPVGHGARTRNLTIHLMVILWV